MDEVALWEHIVQSSGVVGIPKFFAFLGTEDRNNMVAMVYRPTLYRSHPVTPTQFNGQAYGFWGNKDPDSMHADLVAFPGNAFTIYTNIRVDQDHEILTGATAAMANTKVVRVRQAVPLPFALVATLLENENMSPMQFWIQVIRPLIADPAVAANFAPVITWAQVAIMGTHAAPGGTVAVPVPNPDDPLPILTEFRQPLQVQSHLEMPGILVQLGDIQRT